MDDLISRGDVRKYLKECYDDELLDADMKKAVIRLDIYVKNMSAADVQLVKHGKWIIDYAEGRKIYHAHCSECGKEPTRNIGGDYYIDKLSDFCSNCGAKLL